MPANENDRPVRPWHEVAAHWELERVFWVCASAATSQLGNGASRPLPAEGTSQQTAWTVHKSGTEKLMKIWFDPDLGNADFGSG